MPMLSFELKQCPEYVDFGPVLKQVSLLKSWLFLLRYGLYIVARILATRGEFSRDNFSCNNCQNKKKWQIIYKKFERKDNEIDIDCTEIAFIKF